MSDPFIAEIKIFAGNFAPRGYAFCDGQLLPIAQNTAAFSLVGTIYGGDGRTTFGLPNLQSRVPVHAGRGPGLTDRRLGETGGTTTATLNETQLAPHNHGAPAATAAGTSSSPAGASPAAAPIYEEGASGVAPMANEALLPTGGGGAHNNQQPYLALNFIIALVGLFPSQG